MGQEDLAAISSFSKRSLQNYEAGVTIPYKHLAELSRLLRKPMEWFLYGDEATPPRLSDDELLKHVQAVAALAEANQETLAGNQETLAGNQAMLVELLEIVRGRRDESQADDG